MEQVVSTYVMGLIPTVLLVVVFAYLMQAYLIIKEDGWKALTRSLSGFAAFVAIMVACYGMGLVVRHII